MAGKPPKKVVIIDMGRQRYRTRRSSGPKAASSKPESLVNDVLKSPGQPLDQATRSFMEARLGHDFSRVRVHADNRAAESSRLVNADAYTVGHHIAVASPSFNPNTDEGRKLLAHELTHVMQQGGQVPTAKPISIADPAHSSETEATRVAESISSGGPLHLPHAQLWTAVLQRAPKKKKRTNVVLLFDDNPINAAEAGALGGTVVRATSVEDAATQLQGLAPIGTVKVISHGNKEAQIEIFDADGKGTWVPISDLSSALSGAFAAGEGPTSVDFRGCKIGEAGDELEAFRDEVGAKEASGHNCWSFTQSTTPLTIDGVEVTDPKQIPKNMKDTFDQGLLDQVAGMTSNDGHPVGDCLIGLKKGESANKDNLKKIKKLYFANQGRLVATWASPEFNKSWQEGSMCAKDLTTSTDPCKIVKKTKPKK